MNVVDTVKNAAFASAIQAALNYMKVSVMRSVRVSPKKVIGISLHRKYGSWIQVCEKLSLQTLLLTLL